MARHYHQLRAAGCDPGTLLERGHQRRDSSADLKDGRPS